MTRDLFRPWHWPADAIYDAFQAEAAKRRGRTVDQWMDAERLAVWMAARDAALRINARTPTMAEVAAVEERATGHADYGAKWAIGVAEIIKRSAP